MNHSKRDFIKWENQREKLQTLTKIMVMSYPPGSNPVKGYENITKQRQDKYKEIGEELKSLNYTGKNMFLGDRTDWDDESQVLHSWLNISKCKVGVQLYVWQQRSTGLVVFSYRGTYSTPDTYENFAWFGEQYAFYFPNNSLNNWEKWGNLRSDVPERSRLLHFHL